MATKKLSNSRPARWTRAAGELREKVEALQALMDEITNGPLSELAELHAEYEEWYDNMPEGLQQGATGELLAEITGMTVPEECDENSISEVIELADQADGVQLPQGFGRD